jgi:enamine deaminase RidA (YjgF/YER057c/UK114 family)
MQAAQRGLFGSHHPAATLIPVPCLALPDMQIEVEAILACAQPAGEG